MPGTTIANIINAVCEEYSVEQSEVMSDRQQRGIARPRQVAMYLSVCLTVNTLSGIGREFNKDHTTVMYARDSIERHMERDPIIRARIARITEVLGSPAEFQDVIAEKMALASASEAARISSKAFERCIMNLADTNPRLVLDTLYKAFADLK